MGAAHLLSKSSPSSSPPVPGSQRPRLGRNRTASKGLEVKRLRATFSKLDSSK
ncbi:hypothetical protein ACRRTK_023206 [Alexandromys fortis]